MKYTCAIYILAARTFDLFTWRKNASINFLTKLPNLNQQLKHWVTIWALHCNLSTVKPVYIENRYSELYLLSNFLKISVKTPCTSHFVYHTAPIVLWDIPNFPAPGDPVFTLSGF